MGAASAPTYTTMDFTTLDTSRPLSPRGFPQATKVLCPWQKLFLVLLLLGIAVWAWWDWRNELLVLNGILTVFYLLSTLYRMLIIDLALKKQREMVVEDYSTPPDGKEWPRYMVILPMYKEAAILPHLVDGMKKMDYPAERLEIKLLIEEDDLETMEAAEAMDLQPPFSI